MTDEPMEPRERDTEQNPGTVAPAMSPDFDEAMAVREALNGSGVGSDTRAGSLQGGSNSGSEHDAAQTASDRHLADIGQELKAAGTTKPPTT